MTNDQKFVVESLQKRIDDIWYDVEGLKLSKGINVDNVELCLDLLQDVYFDLMNIATH